MSQPKDSIKDQIIAFYNDSLFQKLNAYYNKTTLFNILKIERNENRHSAFLAWLLDKNGSHGLGEEPLKKFMRLLAWAEKDSKYDNPFLAGNYHVVNMEVKTEAPAKVDGKSGRIDIYIKFDYYFGKDYQEENEDKVHHVHIVLENKVYTNEHDDQTRLYYEWARESTKKKKNKTIIGVFLSPGMPDDFKCSGDSKDFSYVKITYGDILVNVIEPILMLDMSDEVRMIVSDYVINLGQPVREKHEEDGKAKMKEDTILAVSNENLDCFLNLYGNYTDLLDASLFTFSVEPKKKKLLKDLFADRFDEMGNCYSTNANLLDGFWKANERLLRMILDAGLNETYEGQSELITQILNIKASNRDNTKYLIYAKDSKTPICERPIPKSLASLFIFKAWLENPDGEVTLEGIRNAFPVREFTNSEKYPYKYIFYRKNDIETALKNDKVEGKTYYRSMLDGDDKEGNKYLTWDFFIDDDDKHCLKIQGEDVLSIKMWLKEEFDRLVKHARSKGIVVEEL